MIQSELMRFVRFRLRIAGLALAVGLVFAISTVPRGEASRETSALLASAFGLQVTESSVNLVTESDLPFALGYRTVVFLASKPHEPRDLYRAEVRVTPTGHPIAVRRLANLTKTSASDEDELVVLGSRVATRSRAGDRYTSAKMIDLSGESDELTADRNLFWDLMWSIRHTIEYGTPHGVEIHSYNLLEPAEEVELALHDDGLVLRFDDTEVRTGPEGRPTSGRDQVDHLPPARVEPSLVPFTVNTVRQISWIGPRGIEWMEHLFFNWLDLGRRGWERVGGSTTSGEELTHEMGVDEEDQPRPANINLADLPEIGFPPPSLEPIRDDPVENEGRWRPMTDTRFVRLNPGAPPFFATTFIRPDTERSYARTFIVIWDPRQVELYPVAGTIEPMSATGIRGSGLVPRDEVDRMVAGFNGGFQATHGEYGMMMEGTLFIPPKGYAATMASLADGRTGFGTWNEDVDVIPPEITAFRQNMTALVQDGEINPFNRDWWGAAPPGARDPTYTQRSGACLTEEGFAAYFWGPSLSPEALGAAMVAARCTHGTHLDMNAVLTGFEFYHVAPTDELPEIDRPLDQDFEREGTVPHRRELSFRSRRLARGMKQLNFPRYVRRDTRDFFWLKLRHVLPGPPLEPVITPPLEGEGAWRAKGLPVGGFPPSFVRTFLRPDPAQPEKRVELIRVDPYTVRAARGASGDWPSSGPSGQAGPAGLLAAIIPGEGATLSQGELPLGRRTIGLVGSKLVRPATVSDPVELSQGSVETLVGIGGPALSEVDRATMALARDPQGFLIVALEPGGDPALLSKALRRAGADPTAAVALGTGDSPAADMVFYAGQGADRRAATLSGREPPSFGSGEALLLVDGHFPQAVRIFPDVPVVPRGRWMRFLNKREVYLRSPDGQYRHVTGEDLPRQAPMHLKQLPDDDD